MFIMYFGARTLVKKIKSLVCLETGGREGLTHGEQALNLTWHHSRADSDGRGPSESALK